MRALVTAIRNWICIFDNLTRSAIWSHWGPSFERLPVDMTGYFHEINPWFWTASNYTGIAIPSRACGRRNGAPRWEVREHRDVILPPDAFWFLAV